MTTRTFRLAGAVLLLLTLTGCLRPNASAVQYSPSNDPSTVGDVYLPSAGGNVGTIVFVHGGAFTEGSRTDIFEFGGPVLSQTLRGWGVLSIDYRFAPFPAAVFDVADAVRFVRSGGGRALGLSASHIVVVGHSAGAAIVGDLAMARNDSTIAPAGTLPAIDGWVSVAGLLDFDAPGKVNAPVAWRTGWAPAAAPLTHLDAADPPALVIHGTADPTVPFANAVRFVASARSAGLPVAVRAVNSFSTCNSHNPLCEETRPDLDAFLDRVARN